MENAKLNKKGNFAYNLLLVLAIIIIMTYAGYRFATAEKQNQSKPIGDSEIRLLNLYNTGESVQYYLSKNAEYNQPNALEAIYNYGGYYSDPCGTSEGYSLWMMGSQNCFLENDTLYEQFSSFYTDKINTYSSNYPSINLTNQYQVTLSGDYFIIEGNELSFVNETLKYYLTPKIKILHYDNLSYILDNMNLIRNNIAQCNNDISCWQKLNPSYKIIQKDNVLYFDLDLNKNVGIFDKKKLVLRFALDFNSYNPLFAG